MKRSNAVFDLHPLGSIVLPNDGGVQTIYGDVPVLHNREFQGDVLAVQVTGKLRQVPGHVADVVGHGARRVDDESDLHFGVSADAGEPLRIPNFLPHIDLIPRSP